MFSLKPNMIISLYIYPSVGRCSWPEAFDSGVGVDGKTLFEYICPCIFKHGRDCYSRILLE